jgi:hypothetical protein
MESLWMLFRYIKSMAVYYWLPEPVDNELISARLVSDKEDIDITPLVVGWLAAKSVGLDARPAWPLDKRLIIEYKHRGLGPYAIYYDPGEDVIWPPRISGIKSVGDLIVLAESDGDLTDLMNKWAGPDGKFGGRLRRTDQSWGSFDAHLILPDIQEGQSVLVCYANDEQVDLVFAK